MNLQNGRLSPSAGGGGGLEENIIEPPSFLNNKKTKRNIRNIVTKGKNINGITSQTEPILVIKIGPTGSGKGSPATDKKIESYGINLDNVVDINIDKVVESNQNFIKKTRNIKRNFNNKKITNKKNLLKALSTEYFGTRQAPRKYLNTKSYLEYLQDVYREAVKGNKNIIVETLGDQENKITQYLTGFGASDFDLSNYTIKILYVHADLNTIQTRVITRANREYQANRAYRLPNSNFITNIYPKIEQMYKTGVDKIIKDYEGKVKSIEKDIVHN